MKRGMVVIAALLTLVVGGAQSLQGCSQPATARAAATVASPTPAVLARGAYLARAADCIACHTAPGGKPYAGGVAFKLPFGVLYSTNITPDQRTGIGTWSDDDFVQALHKGVAPGGRHLYPAFPYTSYAGITRDDALAIKAYLFSLRASTVRLPPNRMNFPFDQRWLMVFWNLLFAHGHVYEARTDRSPEWNRGAYLTDALGHCGECHTPRNLLYGLKSGRKFSGQVLQGWKAYNITSDPTYGIGAWSEEALAQYLSTGHASGHGSAAGPMGEAVENSLQYLTPQDVHAMAVYLKAVRPERGSGGVALVDNPPAARSGAYRPADGEVHAALGQTIFQGACASCHAYNGQGLQSEAAALSGSQAVNDRQGVNLTEVVLHGARVSTAHGAAFMPAFGAAYSDAEIAAVVNYTLHQFGGRPARVTPGEVRKLRAAS